jgi:hypothetical protein
MRFCCFYVVLYFGYYCGIICFYLSISIIICILDFTLRIFVILFYVFILCIHIIIVLRIIILYFMHPGNRFILFLRHTRSPLLIFYFRQHTHHHFFN